MPVRGPRLKIVRRLGVALPGLTRKSPRGDTRTAPPSRRRRKSAHRLRLEEKQKLRWNYGVSERQLRHYLARARRMSGAAGENVLALLERRLDNVVFRLGLAPTIPAARQLVVHGHVTIDARRVDRPAYLVRAGETIALSQRARETPTLSACAEGSAQGGPALRVPSFLCRDPDDPFAGRVVATPTRSDTSFPVHEALVIEHYAR
ncbi:MAG TPA: 30S ribosomal protein S4 [Gemmatimonadaceae bacterium]|nr:30S ribosomal protein S4 [Gemmatimonadaceae bacterium]